MRRRWFIASLGAALLAPPRFGSTQSRVAQAAFLLSVSEVPSRDPPPFWQALVSGLRERGWEEGRNIAFQVRASGGSDERNHKFAAELAGLQPNVIVTAGSQATQAVRQQTSTIPIVMIGAGDPLGAGFIASLARPGGNITGLSNQLGDMAGKGFQILKEFRPGLSRVGFFWNPNDPGSSLGAQRALATAPGQGLEIQSIPIKAREDLDAALGALAQNPPEALDVHPTPILSQNRDVIVAFAVRHRLPSFTTSASMARDGVLASYAPDGVDLWRRAADYVDRILKGANPAELPVEQPTKFQFVINLKTARAIGLEIPPSLLARADEVVE